MGQNLGHYSTYAILCRSHYPLCTGYNQIYDFINLVYGCSDAVIKVLFDSSEYRTYERRHSS